MSEHYGQRQAQGDDIQDPPHGHCQEWGQDIVPTKPEGLGWLTAVNAMCTASQRQRRVGRAFAAAERFVRRAPQGGYPTTMKPFYARDDSYPDARVDLEIYGLAFRDPV
jgi:hypothetical protein